MLWVQSESEVVLHYVIFADELRSPVLGERVVANISLFSQMSKLLEDDFIFLNIDEDVHFWYMLMRICEECGT